MLQKAKCALNFNQLENYKMYSKTIHYPLLTLRQLIRGKSYQLQFLQFDTPSFFFIRMLFSWPRLNIPIFFLPVLG